MTQDNHDYARASDDGMPENDNDLGVDWGKVAAAPDGTLEIAKGLDATKADLNIVYDQAALLLAESRQDPYQKRFVLLMFGMKDVDPLTTEGDIDTIRLAGTAGDDMIATYVQQRLYKRLERLGGGEPANELEI